MNLPTLILIMECIEKNKLTRIQATCPFKFTEHFILSNISILPSLKENNPKRENHTKIYRLGIYVLAIKLDVLDSNHEPYM